MIDGQNGGYDGSSKAIDLKAHFLALKNVESERRIAAETARVSLELAKHSDVFGFDEDTSREELATGLIKSLDPNASRLADLGDENKTIIGRAVFMGLNMMCSDGISGGLLTDMVSDTDIDGIVPEAFKGAGKLIKDLKLTEEDVGFIVKVNGMNNEGNVFDTRSRDKRGQVLFELADSEISSPISKSYLTLERDLMLEMGIPEAISNVTVNSVSVVEGNSPKRVASEKKTDSEGKERKPSPTVINTDATEKNTAGLDDLGVKVEDLAGKVEKQATVTLEQITATKELTKEMKKVEFVLKNLTKDLSIKNSLFSPERDGGEHNRRRSRNGVEFKYSNIVTDLPETEATKMMTESQRKEALFEMQKESIEERLDFLENYKTNTLSDLALSEISYPLFALRDNPSKEVDQRIKDILMARLTMREVSIAMSNNSGSMGEEGKNLVKTISSFEERGYDINETLMKMFYCRDSKEAGVSITMDELGFKTIEAFDWIEYANYRYDVVLSEVKKSKKFQERIMVWEQKKRKVLQINEALEMKKKNPLIDINIESEKIVIDTNLYEFDQVKTLEFAKGTTLEDQVFNFTNDIITGNERALIVRDFLIDKLKNQLGLDDYHAEKSLQLAEEMNIATMEFFITDWDFLNGNQYNEAVNNGFWKRVDGVRSGKGKLTGPISSYGVDTMTPGFLRGLCKKYDPTVPIYAEEIAENLILGRLIEKRTYTAHFISVICGKVWKAKELMAETAVPDPKDLNKEYFRSKLDLFNKADAEIGSKGKLKTMWVAGLYERMIAIPHLYKNSVLKETKRILTEDLIYSIPEPGYESGTDGETFLSEAQWNFVEKLLNIKGIMREDMFIGGLLDAFAAGAKRK